MLPLSIFVSDPIMRAYAEHRQFLPKLYAVLVVLLFIALWLGTSRFGLIWAIAVVVGVNIIGRTATWIKIGSLLSIRLRDLALLKDVGKIAIAATTAAVFTAVVRSLVHGLVPIGMLSRLRDGVWHNLSGGNSVAGPTDTRGAHLLQEAVVAFMAAGA